MTKYLLDVNILLALLASGHPHSPTATAWLESVSDPGCLGICRVVEMAALRLLTRRAVMGEALISASEAWGVFETLLTDDRFELLDEPPGLRKHWKAICGAIPKGACAETDAFLAAFAISGGRTLVTLDRGMLRFAGLESQLLA